jgi:para-nitrobenzyl esterase
MPPSLSALGPSFSPGTAAANVPAYLYHFTRVALLERTRKLGAFHSLELFYVFGNFPTPGFDPTDHALSRTMMGYWTRFAATGNPNSPSGPTAAEPAAPYWPAYEPTADPYMELGDTVTAKSGLYKEAGDVLDRLLRERGSTIRRGEPSWACRRAVSYHRYPIVQVGFEGL